MDRVLMEKKIGKNKSWCLSAKYKTNNSSDCILAYLLVALASDERPALGKQNS